MMRAAALALALLLPSIAAAQQQQRQQPPRQDDLAQQVERNMRTCLGTSQDVALAARCMDGSARPSHRGSTPRRNGCSPRSRSGPARGTC